MSESNALNVDQRFGRRVRQEREELTFGQETVAMFMRQLHGVQWHQTTVAKVEAGTRPVKLSEAVALAHVLATDLPTLVADLDLHAEQRQAAQHRARRAEVERMGRYVELRLAELDELEKAEQHDQAEEGPA